VSGLAPAHHGQKVEDELDRAKVVELHGALEIVETVIGVADFAADRSAGVVDQDVDMAVSFQDIHCHLVDLIRAGEVAYVNVRYTAGVFDIAPRLLQQVAALPIPEEAPVIMTMRPWTATSSESATTPLQEVSDSGRLSLVRRQRHIHPHDPWSRRSVG
jgi:hypothetical protein